MKKLDGVKVLSAVAMVVGAAASLLSDMARGKEMEKTIEEKVNEALKDKK